MQRLIFILLTLLLSGNTFGQNYDFGKISKSELKEKYHPTDSSIAAAVLYKNEDISFFYSDNDGFIQQRDVHQRIKIYSKEGFDWATKKIYLYAGDSNNKETLTGLKAFSYNLVNDKIEKEKLRKDGEFEEDYNEFTKVNSFTMPEVKEGTVIEYKYRITTKSVSIDDVIFQYSIPINKLEVKIAIPEYYVFNQRLNLRAAFLPKLNNETRNNTVPFDFKTNITFIDESNVPPLKSEAYSGNLDNYRSKMSLELTAFLNSYKVVEKSFSTTWEKVSKTIYESSNFGGQLRKFNFYKDELNALITGVTDDFEKALLVENFVKSKIKWNGNYGKFAQYGVRKAYMDKSGNDADINLLVTSMLRSVGVDANPVLISTRDNGIPLFPTRKGFNYVICSVRKDNNYLFIDATDQYGTGNILPFRVLNWQGRLIEENGVSSWVDVMPKNKSTETTFLNAKINEDFSITGKVAKNFTSYSAYGYRAKYNNMSEEDHIKSLEDEKGDIEISELNVENKDEISEAVKLSYEYELLDGADEIGDKVYFTPMLFFATKENPFKLDERIYPIDYVLPFKDSFIVNVMIPEGYVVESLPDAGAMEFKGSQVKFLYFVKANGSYLQLRIDLEVNNPIILPADYKDYKDFYSKIIEKQTEQVVLSKA